MAITRAQRRALLKAAAAGRVMRAGGFGEAGEPFGATWQRPDFDRALVVDRLIAAGLMAPGDGYNTAVLTDKGHEIVGRLRVKAEPA